jgi:hypothetical protein
MNECMQQGWLDVRLHLLWFAAGKLGLLSCSFTIVVVRRSEYNDSKWF